MTDEILICETVDSTNQVARELAMQGRRHGFAVVARSQLAGRGRLGKQWQSPPGLGLYCTYIVRPDLDVTEYPKITLTAGLAVSLALEKKFHLPMQLKWPNDLFISGKKCGGILVETSSLSDMTGPHFALVGVGVNVNGDVNSFPPGLQSTATSVFIETGNQNDIPGLCQEIREELLAQLHNLSGGSFATILQQWRQRDMLQGRWMRWTLPSRYIIYGEALGVDDQGLLRVRDRAGVVYEVLSGDVTLGERDEES